MSPRHSLRPRAGARSGQSGRRRSRILRLLGIGLALALAACELEETTLTEPEDVIVAEVYLHANVSPQYAFLHRTLGTTGDGRVIGARIEIRNRSGERLDFLEEPTRENCLVLIEPPPPGGTCYRSRSTGFVFPGEPYILHIELPDGRALTGSTVVPGDFQLLAPRLTNFAPSCRLPPDTALRLVWSPAADAWAYVGETNLFGLRAALEPRGIEVEEDPLRLFGLSRSSADTAIVFPTEFGIFERLDLDRDLALAIRHGLPDETRARITIAAVDRNYVLWARGGNFNPSGLVRVPTIRGDGTGVFASLVPKEVFVVVDDSTSWVPDCRT
ncbi:MAG: hypothetical protein HY561_10565 [Gemmatimonadetes bacterium]|nr:hypothetical protein [Gemmatimonadota bacterium]